jgi:ribonuclease HI
VIEGMRGGEIDGGKHPAGRHTCSATAEQIAIDEGLKQLISQRRRLQREEGPIKCMWICTDSQSTVKKLQRGAAAQRGQLAQDLWKRLRQVAREYGAEVKLQYVCGHANVAMNERADCLADQAAELMQQDDAPVELAAAAAVCRRRARESWEATENRKLTDSRVPLTEHHVWKQVTRKGKTRYGEVGREYERAMAQLRTGQCMWLRAHLHRCEKVSQPTCTQCGAEAEGTEHFLLECSEYEDVRKETIGTEADLTVLAQEPEKVAEYIRRTGRLAEHKDALKKKKKEGRPGGKGGQPRGKRDGESEPAAPNEAPAAQAAKEMPQAGAGHAGQTGQDMGGPNARREKQEPIVPGGRASRTRAAQGGAQPRPRAAPPPRAGRQSGRRVPGPQGEKGEPTELGTEERMAPARAKGGEHLEKPPPKREDALDSKQKQTRRPLEEPPSAREAAIEHRRKPVKQGGKKRKHSPDPQQPAEAGGARGKRRDAGTPPAHKETPLAESENKIASGSKRKRSQEAKPPAQASGAHRGKVVRKEGSGKPPAPAGGSSREQAVRKEGSGSKRKRSPPPKPPAQAGGQHSSRKRKRSVPPRKPPAQDGGKPSHGTPTKVGLSSAPQNCPEVVHGA